MPPRKRPSLSRWTRLGRWYARLPQPARHGLVFAARLGGLTLALYFNASHFDVTEYRTILAMALFDAVGFKRRSV